MQIHYALCVMCYVDFFQNDEQSLWSYIKWTHQHAHFQRSVWESKMNKNHISFNYICTKIPPFTRHILHAYLQQWIFMFTLIFNSNFTLNTSSMRIWQWVLLHAGNTFGYPGIMQSFVSITTWQDLSHMVANHDLLKCYVLSRQVEERAWV